MVKDKTDFSIMGKKLSVMQTLGVPYSDKEVENAASHAQQQAKVISDRLREGGVQDPELESREVVALIAYLQRLGKPESDFIAETDRMTATGGKQ